MTMKFSTFAICLMSCRVFFAGFVRGVGRGLAGSVLKPVSKFGEAISDMGSGAVLLQNCQLVLWVGG